MMTKPRKARKGEDPDAVHWYEDKDRPRQLYEYCKQDVVATRDLYHALWQLSAEEQHIWEMDQRINDRGFHVDSKLLLAMRKIITDAAEDINELIRQKTGGAVDSVDKVVALKAWLQKNCRLKIDSLDKKTIAKLLADPKLPPLACEVLELRLAGAQAATKKVDAFLSRRDPDDRVRGAFVFHSAGTGRWASRGAQVHNLKRLTTEDQEFWA
jgi:DNA polymerase bacteriophage-type